MINIALISDTHGYLDHQVLSILAEADEIWHAGDLGDVSLLDQMKDLGKPVRAVYGNIDNATVRLTLPAQLEWELDGKKFFMTHIGGYPGHYAKGIKTLLLERKPDVFICGHSHILKVIFDKELNLLHLNPGACGKEGFHPLRTMLKFSIDQEQIKDMAVVELGKRGRE
ncbi:MAG TPA: metallophosphoesterase family protein [Saprospiraceae bacterium]|nr:metallophosphoesterase family protein [Saprospiraceae bacterium]